MPALRRRVARIARRAEALGLPVPKLAVTGTSWEWEYSYNGERLYKLHFDHVEVVNPFVGVAGWRLLARIEHGVDLADLVHGVPCAVEHEARAEAYRGRGPVCDHCALDRRRNDTFVVLHEATGEVAQLGRTCLQDFTGHDVLGHFSAGAALSALMRDDDEPLQRPGEPEYALTTAVSIALAVIKRDGGYRPTAHPSSTRDEVTRLLDLLAGGEREDHDDDDRADLALTVEALDHHRERAALVVAWIGEGIEGNGSYANNLRALFADGLDGSCLRRHLGLVVSAPAAYDRAHRTDRASDRPPAPAVVEGRQVIRGEVIKVDTRTNQYGTRVVMTVRDDEGRAYWGTVPRDLNTREGVHGERVEFTATVEASDRKSFGFFKRPAKGRIL